jgi:hypothetical protein
VSVPGRIDRPACPYPTPLVTFAATDFSGYDDVLAPARRPDAFQSCQTPVMSQSAAPDRIMAAGLAVLAIVFALAGLVLFWRR